MGNLKYHLVAFLIVAIWGSTFVFTKMLLLAGLSPAQIFTFRFFIAYILLLAFSFLRDKVTSSPPESGGVRGGLNKRSFRLFCKSMQDELLMVLLGITGGSLYFLAENAAMLFTTATNTSLIVCSCPLFAMLLFAIVYRHSERITKFQALGSIIACLGMAAVVLNGHFVLHLSPLGDMLAFAACLCWAVYSLLMKRATEHYSSLFITRKVFFYGLMTIIPYFILRPSEATILSFSIFNFQLSIINYIKSSLPWCCRLDALLSHLELGLFQSHHHDHFCLVAAPRTDYRLVPPWLCPDSYWHVSRRQEKVIEKKTRFSALCHLET